MSKYTNGSRGEGTEEPKKEAMGVHGDSFGVEVRPVKGAHEIATERWEADREAAERLLPVVREEIERLEKELERLKNKASNFASSSTSSRGGEQISSFKLKTVGENLEKARRRLELKVKNRTLFEKVRAALGGGNADERRLEKEILELETAIKSSNEAGYLETDRSVRGSEMERVNETKAEIIFKLSQLYKEVKKYEEDLKRKAP